METSDEEEMLPTIGEEMQETRSAAQVPEGIVAPEDDGSGAGDLGAGAKEEE